MAALGTRGNQEREGREFPFTPELRQILEAQKERVIEIAKATNTFLSCLFVYRPDALARLLAAESRTSAVSGSGRARRSLYSDGFLTTFGVLRFATLSAREYLDPPR